eukprot:1158801-Pelagomonas_calceolata.AAC.19
MECCQGCTSRLCRKEGKKTNIGRPISVASWNAVRAALAGYAGRKARRPISVASWNTVRAVLAGYVGR